MTTQIQEYSKTEQALAALREKYADVTYDVDTPEGFQEAKSARSEVRGYRTGLEKMRKDIKAPALERCRLIDIEAKRITSELVALESPIDEQIKEVDARKEAERQKQIEAEVKRVEDIQSRIARIRDHAGAALQVGITAKNIEQSIADIETIEIDDSFDEFQEQAADARIATLARLREIHAATVEREAEDARIKDEREELAKLRAENEKREAEEQAKREAAEAEAREKREAADKKQREELEEQRKKQAAAQKKIDDENARLAKERADLEREQREEADRKAAEERAKQERKAAAEAAAKKAKYPGDEAIINALAEHFGVPAEVATTWLTQIRRAA